MKFERLKVLTEHALLSKQCCAPGWVHVYRMCSRLFVELKAVLQKYTLLWKWRSR